MLLLVWSTPLFAFNGVRESLCCAQSCRKLREACQEPLLWREHAFLLHYIQPVDEQQYVAAQAADVINCLGWQLFVRLNAASRKGVLVRLAGHDLRLPLYSFQDPLLRVKALYFLLRKIFAKLPGSWPFRLRWLQWGGRPGHLVEQKTAASVLSGSRLFIEFADDTLRGWKLPPHIFHAGIHFNLEDMRSSLWRPVAQLPQGYLLRVVSSMLPSEQWLHLSVEADLWNLIEEVCILLRHQTQDFAASSRPLHFRLADMQPVSVVDPDTRTDGHPLLWDLAWAQCETISVEVEKNTSSGGDKEILLVDLKREPGRCASPLSSVPAERLVRREGASESDREVEVETSSDERIVPHLPPLLIPGTQKCRQFEFHPEQPDVLLIGDKDGCAKILVQGGSEATTTKGPATQVDSCALLALSWLRRADVAVCGAACSGTIQFLRYFPDSRKGPALAGAGSVREKFPKLSSLSVNCSDNFLLASGISSSISIFDIETGNLFCRGSGVHEHFINISRFSNTSPHVFATASFDHSCKIWDLRRPLRKPVKTLQTEGHNVMCTFSPDDRYFLASGVDTRMTQFEVATWESRSMPLRKPIHQGRYRRSAYLANSKFIVTGSTEESHVHLLSVMGRKLGCVEFDRLEALAAPRRSQQDLIRGTVVLDDKEPLDRSASPSRAYVQSIRAHPVIPNRVGVLMTLPEGDSHIAMLHLDQKEMKL